MAWKFHVDESSNGRYNMIPGTELLTALVLDLKCYEASLFSAKDDMKGVSHLWLTYATTPLYL